MKMDILLDPYEWWVEPFLDNSDLRIALFAGLLAVICSSIIGTWVIIRGISFYADALAHGVLPGVAIAFTLSGNTTLGAIIAGIFMIGGIQTIRRFSPLPSDVSIGLMFVGMLALAVVILGGEEEEEEIHGFLFGNVLEVTGGDLILLGATAFLILGMSIIFYRAILTTTFDMVLSRLLKLHPGVMEMGLLFLLMLSIVASFKVVGSLLVFALLIAPPASAALFCRKAWVVMIVGGLQGIVSVILGLLISHHLETSPGSAVALTSVGIFFVVLILKISSIAGGGGGRNDRQGEGRVRLPIFSAQEKWFKKVDRKSELERDEADRADSVHISP